MKGLVWDKSCEDQLLLLKRLLRIRKDSIYDVDVYDDEGIGERAVEELYKLLILKKKWKKERKG